MRFNADKKTIIGTHGYVGQIFEWQGANWEVRAHVECDIGGSPVSVTRLVRVGRIGGL